MNYNDITIAIVTFKSEKVIFQCLNSIKKIKKIIIFDNSNDKALKNKVTKKYPNINYILSKKNLGYAKANNKILRLCKSSHVLILNPDTILEKNCIKNLISKSIILKNKFSILAPSSKYKNYGFFKDLKEKRFKIEGLIDVDYVKGFAMLINLSKIKKIGLFDKNFFLYLEEIDLCKRLKKRFEKIFIAKNAKIKHLDAKSSDIGFEFNKCQNWHWMWSNVYYDIKNVNFIFAFKKSIIQILKNYFKAIFFIIFFKKKKSLIYYLRASGSFNSLMRRDSWYRPKIL
jgi:N-acetylglucosaminyl-diphospho-decaprenol L-rhamnosyltransferase